MTPSPSTTHLKLSIIIPCFNCASTLREAVNSCYIQGFTPEEFEIILVNDCSTDDTMAMMTTLADEHANIKTHSHELNQGGGATRNTATRLASANLVFCLDSDDILSPHMLERMVQMQHDTNADGIAIETSIKFRGTDVTDIAFSNTFGYRNQIIPLESLLQRSGIMCPLYSTFMYTKAAFETIGGYPTNHGFDTQGIAWRFLAHKLTAYTCPDTVYYHRVNFNESYYLREHNAGRTNINWKLILLENNAVLTDEALALVLNFNERNFEIDLITQLRKLPTVFSDVPKIRTLDSAKLVQQTPIRRSSLRGLFYRLQAKTTRVVQQITHRANFYVTFIYRHIKAKQPIYTLVAWHLIRIQRFFKVGFTTTEAHDNEPMDLYLVTIYKDFQTLPYVIEAAKKHVQHQLKNVYIVTRLNEEIQKFCLDNGYHFVDENSVLGYGKDAITYRVGDLDRSGWMLQQLLKFNGDTIVQSENYLSICTDTILVRPHKYLDGNKIIFRQNEEWHKPYFTNFAKIFGYPTKTWFSYTSHMMLFNKTMMRELKAQLEAKHGKTWDQVYLSTISSDEQSCISDYDTYANWVRCNYPERVKNIPLYNSTFSRTELAPLPELERRFSGKYHSVSFHAHATPANLK